LVVVDTRGAEIMVGFANSLDIALQKRKRFNIFRVIIHT